MKSSSTSKPWKKAQPFIMGAANSLQDTYKANQPRLQEAADSIQGLLPSFRERVSGGDPTLQAGRGYTEGVLGGRFLDQQNPHLDGIVRQTSDSVTDRINSIFGAAGRTGSGRHMGVLSRELADSENGLRAQEYGRERAAMEAAAGRSGTYGQAENQNLGAYLAATEQAASLPYLGANMLSRGMGGLLGGYQTQTQKPSLGMMLMQGASNAAQAYATGGFGK